jgi:excisionase family DNA binding protein
MNRPRAYPNLLTTRQVAERLSIHHKTAQRLVASGEIPNKINVGGEGAGARWRVSETDLQLWIESRKAAA